MNKLKFIYSNCRALLLVFIFIYSVYFSIFSQEVFAMDPCTVLDQYGNSEYIGKDSYGHFNNPVNKSVVISPDTIQQTQSDSYGTTPPYESDWYGSNKVQVIHDTIDKNNSVYISMKRRACWYLWKIHSQEYNNYKDFKNSWNPQTSIRKEFFKDIKKAFKNPRK